MKSGTGVVWFLVLCVSCSGSDWTRFRGADGSGVAENQTIPENIDHDSQIRWKINIPSGTSSPIVCGDRLFLTSHTGDDRTLHCFDCSSGLLHWERSVRKTHAEVATAPAGPATPTPVTDGKSVFVLFPDAGIFAWSLDGTELWRKPVPVSATMHGLSASLVCHEDRIFQVVDQLRDSYVRALSTATGDEIWKQERLSGLTGAYSTPVLCPRTGDSPLLITTGPFEVVAYDVTTGERVWWVQGKTNAPASSPVRRGDRLYFCEPVGEPIPISMLAPFDKNADGRIEISEASGNEAIKRLLVRIDGQSENQDQAVDEAEWDQAFRDQTGRGGLVAVDVSGRGDVTATHVRWTFEKGMPYIAGVLADGVDVMAVSDGGILTIVDAETGRQKSKFRLEKGHAQYYASPVAASGLAVVSDIHGVMNILRRGDGWKAVCTLDLKEDCIATPAIAHNCLFVRTSKTLYCFGKS